VAALSLAVAVAPASAAPDPGKLQQKAPAKVDYNWNTDFMVGINPVPIGNSTAAVTAVNYGSPLAGCEQSDFAGFPMGDIALVSRGLTNCFFATRALNAQAAGASGLLITNQVAGLFEPSLNGANINIPVLFIATDVGNAFAALSSTGLRVHMQVKTPEELADGS
jgi:hypothetical protein